MFFIDIHALSNMPRPCLISVYISGSTTKQKVRQRLYSIDKSFRSTRSKSGKKSCGLESASTTKTHRDKSKPDLTIQTDPESTTDSNPLVIESAVTARPSTSSAAISAKTPATDTTATTSSRQSRGFRSGMLRRRRTVKKNTCDSPVISIGGGDDDIDGTAPLSSTAAAAASGPPPVSADASPDLDGGNDGGGLPTKKARRLQRLRQLSRSSSWKLGRTIFKSTFR